MFGESWPRGVCVLEPGSECPRRQRKYSVTDRTTTVSVAFRKVRKPSGIRRHTAISSTL